MSSPSQVVVHQIITTPTADQKIDAYSLPFQITPPREMAPTIVLITGASRGLGRGLAQRFPAKPDHVVIAANRDPSGATSTALQDLPKGEGSRLIVVKLDSAVEADAIEAVKTLETQGIDSLDIVVANAGISEVYPEVSALNASDLQRHVTVNVLGVVWLYQAVLPLLRKSTNPKWVNMGSSAGGLEVGFFLLVRILFHDTLSKSKRPR